MYEHNCVIIPNFGGMLCQVEHAYVDPVAHTLYPPSRRVSFNARLKVNDGLLATTIADNLKITYSDAIKIIEAEVGVLEQKLRNEGQLAIDSIGNFVKGEEGNIIFNPEKQSNFLLDSFGLSPVKLQMPHSSTRTKIIEKQEFQPELKVPVMETEETNLHEAEEIVETEEKPKRKRSRRGLVYSIIGTVLVIMLAFNAYIFLQEGTLSPVSKKISALDLGGKIKSWFSSSSSEQEFDSLENHEQTPPASTELTPEATLTENTPTETPAEATTEAPAVEHPYADITEGTNYYIIAGAFAEPANADRMLEQVKANGYSNAIIIQKQRKSGTVLNMVAYVNFNDYKAAENKLADINSGENPEAWIYEMK